MRKLLALLTALASPALAQTPAGVINAPIYATGYISQVGGTNVTTNIPPQPNHPTNLNIYTTGAISGTWTIKLPNPAFEGQVLSFNCGAAANAISVMSSDGSSIDSTIPSTCSINSGFTIQFDQRSNIWRNIGSNNTSTFKPFTGVASQWPWQLNTDGTWTTKRIGFASIAEFGSTCNDAAFAAAIASGNNIHIPKGVSCSLTANTTVPRGTIWRMENGAAISVASGKTLKFRSRLDAGRYQIFTGTGAVIGISPALPEWWGANGAYGNTDDSKAAFQAAINSATAVFDPADPTNYSDVNGLASVSMGPGYFNLCSPLDIYPVPTSPIELSGYGVWNAGTWLQACDTFAGGSYPNLINVHGVAVGTNNVWQINFHDFSIHNPNKTTAVTGAGIRFVPEGNGYWLNSFHKASIIRNVLSAGFPVGFDIVNTLQMRVQDSSANYRDNTDTSNSTGFRVASAGNNATGSHAGEIVFDNIQTNLCPGNNVGSCTNTIGLLLQSDAANADVAAISLVNSIFEPSNIGVKGIATGGGSIGDIWFHPGTQFDGYGCQYLYFEAQTGSRVYDVHADHLYHTGAADTSCISHYFYANGGTVFNIFDTNNEFVLGPSANAIIVQGATDFNVSGNIINGGTAASDAILVQGSSANGNIANNVIKGTWRWGVKIASTVTNTTAIGNNCKGASLTGTCAVDDAALTGITNNVFGNGDRPVAYTPTIACQVGSIGANTLTGNYSRTDAVITVNVDLTITTNSTCAGRLQISLPRPPFGPHTLNGFDMTSGSALQGMLADFDPTLYVYKYDGTYPGASGHTYYITATYQAR